LERKHSNKPVQPRFRINEQINVPHVRVVGEEGEQLGILPIDAALRLAREREVDLVEFAPAANPPVCRLIELSKFKYEIKKKEKDAKAKQHIVVLKEIRFGPNTDEHDYNFKLRHAAKFLQEGNKIKTYITFYGRSIVHNQRGRVMLEKFAEDLSEWAKIEMAPKLEGKRMFMILTPKK